MYRIFGVWSNSLCSVQIYGVIVFKLTFCVCTNTSTDDFIHNIVKSFQRLWFEGRRLSDAYSVALC